jgi:DNA-binding NarL/FixJ family response regulator
MGRSLRVLLVDDTRLYADSLANRLSRFPGIREVVQATCARTAASRLADGDCDVVLLNTAMDDSIAVLHALLGHQGVPPTLALGVSEMHEDVVAILDQRVTAYLPRHGSVLDLVDTITAAVAAPRKTRRHRSGVPNRIRHAGSHRQSTSRTPLTRREVQVLALIATGMTNQAIADRLGIQIRTVKNHVHNILAKMGVNRRDQAVARIRSSAIRSEQPLQTEPG